MRAEKEGERQVSLLSSHIETTDGRTKEEVHDDGCRRTYLVRRKEEEDLLGVRYLESVVARFDHFSSSSAAQFPAGIFPENVRGRRGRKGGGGEEEEGEKTAAAPRPVTVGKKSRRREDPTHIRIHAADTGLYSAEQKKKHLFPLGPTHCVHM